VSRSRSARILAHYFFAQYLLILFLCLPYLRRAWLPGFGSDLYAVALDLSQAALYLLPAVLLTELARVLLLRRRVTREAARARHLAVCAIAVLATTATAVAIEADCRIFEIFGFHLNGFVLNLVTTPGGIESMGVGREGVAVFVRGLAGLAALDFFLMWGAQRVARPEGRPAGRLRRSLYRFGAAALVLVALGERATYAVGETRANGNVLAQATAFPFYVPLTARNLLLDLGLAPPHGDAELAVDPASSRLRYPLAPLRVEPPAHPLNVVWLVGESLRWDALDPEIMPAAYGLAQKSWRFTHHYSGGNGTRMGMFSMFYGVHGPYWFEFLAERRSPVLMDVVQQQGYQLGLFTSARFSYPEFDRTIFANVPARDLHESADNYHTDDWERGWQNDRARVSDLLGFLGARDRTRPFLAFMFFESTHYRYYFPDESVIRRPYATDVSLDELRSEENASLSHARYLNAAHHLDSQIGRILDYLAKDHAMGDTVVLITGDHGEEFYEKGRKGHNSEFHEEQIHVPLVLWIPGDAGREVARMTSHVDIPATLLPLLGLRNPASDYSLGVDLRAETEHSFGVVSDWSRIGILERGYKLTVPVNGAGLLEESTLTTPDDGPIADPAPVYHGALPVLRGAIDELHRFQSS
jgi:membrane-anchored protein YejM (alkaline phosphatase superfamily)